MNKDIKYLVERLFDNNDELLTNDELTLDELNVSDNLDKLTFIDLGLPSGILWADRNFLAKHIEDDGEYYTNNEIITKIKSHHLLLPTYDGLNELEKYTNIHETNINGKKVLEFKSKKNGNSIFFPYAGYITLYGSKHNYNKNVVIPSGTLYTKGSMTYITTLEITNKYNALNFCTAHFWPACKFPYRLLKRK